jgi:uncharacterized membrane protein
MFIGIFAGAFGALLVSPITAVVSLVVAGLATLFRHRSPGRPGSATADASRHPGRTTGAGDPPANDEPGSTSTTSP